MKTKEEIIEEIKLNVVDIIFNREAGWSDKLEKIIDFWITKALDQTREETIREVEEMIKKEFPHQKLYCEAQDLRCEILDELNKLKK